MPERGGPFRRRARTARLTVRCEAVDLVPPVEVGGETMRMVAVSAREERPAKEVEAKKEALHWLLPATEGEPGAGTAATVLRWFELRWRIERYFDALKNGTRIKDRRLDYADDLKKCLAFDAITAFRVWGLARPAQKASMIRNSIRRPIYAAERKESSLFVKIKTGLNPASKKNLPCPPTAAELPKAFRWKIIRRVHDRSCLSGMEFSGPSVYI